MSSAETCEDTYLLVQVLFTALRLFAPLWDLFSCGVVGRIGQGDLYKERFRNQEMWWFCSVSMSFK